MLEKSGIYTGWADGAMLQLQTGMNDSKLTWKEFKAKVSTPEQASAKAALRAKFDEVDANGTGNVGKKELSKALREDKVLLTQIAETHPVLACWVEPFNGVSKAGRDYLMDRMDDNKDGVLTFDEFEDLLEA